MNGQLYDANSGRLFHHPRGPVIDGFGRKPRPGRIINKVTKTLTAIDLGYTPAKSRPHRPAQKLHKRTQRSSTLMRSAVKKPHSKGLSSKFKLPKVRTAAPNPARLSRAMNMIKNPRVDRFGLPLNQTKSVMADAARRTKPAIDTTIVSAKSSTSTAVALRPPSMITSVSHQRLERMLDKALIGADAHKKALNGRLNRKGRLARRLGFLPRWLTISIVAMVVVLVGSYFAWRNIPYISMKFASVRAQVKGSLPDYIPSGFKFAGPIEYQSGTISMKFQTETEDRYFTIVQQASNWDSSSLEANTVPDDSRVQTSQVKGTTVYNYGNRTTWVNNGSKYTIQDNAKLNYDELRKIAESIF